MQTHIRQIGNSKGVIIPAAFLAEAGFRDKVEISLKNQQVIITPAASDKKELRIGWFDNYNAEKDIDAWQGFVELPSEQEEWEW